MEEWIHSSRREVHGKFPRPGRTPTEPFGQRNKKTRGARFWAGFILAFMTIVPFYAYCLYRALTQLPTERQVLAGILMLASAIFFLGAALMMDNEIN